MTRAGTRRAEGRIVRLYRFGEFVLDMASGELRKGYQRLRLRPQPAAALAYLLQNPGTVVTRDELRRVLWPDGTYVDFDHGLNSCIKQIRAALADQRQRPRFLETLPRRGYRFKADVIVEEGGNGSHASDYDVSGSVHISGTRMRVAIRLADRTDSRKVWTTSFEKHLEDAPAETEIASLILQQLVRAEAMQRT